MSDYCQMTIAVELLKENPLEDYRHYLSGFFAHRDQAEKALADLVAAGLPPARVHIIDKDSMPDGHEATESSEVVLKDIVVDSAIGGAVGTGVGALLTVGMVAANVTLFVASPIIAPLVMLGWGAGLGGLVGASVGASEKARPLSDLVKDAVTQGGLVVIAETASAEETEVAGKIFKDAVGDFEEAVER
jgi:hypothetical protein